MAVTSSRCGGAWFSPSFNANAIAKHDECAAAANSSGLVFPPGCSVREAQVNGRPSSAPLLPSDSVPSPDASGPFRLKHEGDIVQRGDTLVEIETDKATMELEAYDSGVLTRIIAPAGSTVPIGQPIAVIDDQTAGAITEPVGEQAVSTAVTDSAPAAVETPASLAAPAEVGPAQASSAAAPVRATPLVRSLAREHGIDLSAVTGTGPGGRIVRADIEAVISQRSAATEPDASAVVHTVVGAEGDKQVPLSSIRRITAQRLTESAAAPHFYLTSVTDADALQKLRAEFNTEFSDTGPKISVTDLLIRACVRNPTYSPRRQFLLGW